VEAENRVVDKTRLRIDNLFCLWSMGLVDYDSGSDTENPRAVEVSNQTIYEADYQQSRTLTNAKRRKRPLPSLPDTYDSGKATCLADTARARLSAGIGPNDNPAQHQGRKRTRPYVDGDYDTHIYLSRPFSCHTSSSYLTRSESPAQTTGRDKSL